MQLECSYLPADVFGLSESARRALAGRPNPPGFDGLVVPAALSDIPFPEDHWQPDARQELVAALRAGLAPFAPHVRVLDAVRELAEPGTTIVMTGQQPGFLGGPLLDLHKAAHAVRLARALREAWGRPVVAGFWNHSDDHDLGEVHHLWIQNKELDLRKVGLSGASSSRTPLFDVRFDAERQRLGAVREVLRQNLWEGGPLERTLDAFMPKDGEAFGEAFGRTLLELFGGMGLIVFEPRLLREPLSRALAGALGTPWRPALVERAEALRESGLDVPIEPASAALLFRLEGGKKQALRFRDDSGELAYDGEPGSRTQAELAAEILAAPGDWIPGALLRPVLQDAVLPTAAYVGGWGELAYHLQLSGLRKAVEVPMPPFVPRVSATLVTPEARHALTRLTADVGDVLRAGGRFEADGEGGDPPILAELNAVRERTKREVLGLGTGLRELDPGLANQAKRTANQIASLFERLAQKATRVHATQSGRGQRHLRRLNEGLVPRGQPQERIRGALEFVARFGTAWIEDWIERIDPLPTEHVVLDFIEEDSA